MMAWRLIDIEPLFEPTPEYLSLDPQKNFDGILILIDILIKQNAFKMSSTSCRLFCLSSNVLIYATGSIANLPLRLSYIVICQR